MTVEPHAVAFRFGTAVPQQGDQPHPAELALASGTITMQEFFDRAPFLALPHEGKNPEINRQASALIRKRQATIAAIMQKTAKDEGNHKAAPASPAVQQNAAAAAAKERKTGLILATLEAKPWAFGGEIAEPCRMSISTCFNFLRALEASGQVQVTATREGKRYAIAGHPPFFRALIRHDHIEERVIQVITERPGLPTYKVIEATHADKKKVKPILTKLLEEGKIIAKRGPGKGSMWRIAQ